MKGADKGRGGEKKGMRGMRKKRLGRCGSAGHYSLFNNRINLNEYCHAETHLSIRYVVDFQGVIPRPPPPPLMVPLAEAACLQYFLQFVFSVW